MKKHYRNYFIKKEINNRNAPKDTIIWSKKTVYDSPIFARVNKDFTNIYISPYSAKNLKEGDLHFIIINFKRLF